LRRQSRPSWPVHSGWSQSGQDELYCCSAGGLIDWHRTAQGSLRIELTAMGPHWRRVWLLWFCFGLQSVHMMVQPGSGPARRAFGKARPPPGQRVSLVPSGGRNCHPYWTIWPYSYYLPTLMAGPHVFYSDFIAHFTAHTNSNEDKQYLNRAVLRALACTGLYSFLVLGLGPMLPYYWLSLPRRILYVSGAFFLVRCKYYFAWSLAEAACLAHGFGFSGTDPSTGKPRYDLAKSFFFKDVEIGTSIRAVVAGWNVSTARRVRRLVRPHFQTSRSASLAYDCLTGLCANLAQNYAQGVFFLLEMGYALRFWSAMYFAGHILLCAMLLLCLPSQPGVASDLMCFAQKYIVPPIRAALLPGCRPILRNGTESTFQRLWWRLGR
uniref:Lysophospholipid acyltransferase 5 n=1 Tax=Macrostomum lignano TaxID=282301 RepID=A0A1I8FG24_9PLAT